VLRALERRREDRFASAADFDHAVVALQVRYGSGEALDVPPGIAPRAPLAPVERVDPDPLRTVRLASQIPPAPRSVDDVTWIGAAAAARNPREAAGPSELLAPPRETPAWSDAAVSVPDMGVPLRRVSARGGRRFARPAAFALAAALVLAVLWYWPSAGGRPGAAPARHAATAPPRPATPAPTPAAAPTEAPVEVAPPPIPTAAPEPAASPITAEAPAPEPTAVPTEAPASPPDDLARLAQEAATARRRADEIRGRDFAPTTYQRALARQAAAEKLAARGSGEQAAALYREAANLFTRAAAVAAQTHPSTARPPRTGSPRASAEPQAPNVVPAETGPAEAPAEAPAPRQPEAGPDASAAPAAEPRAAAAGTHELPAETRALYHRQILETVGDYAWSRRNRNAEMLARVFPSDRGRFDQDSRGARPPAVVIEVQAIELDGANRAVATVQERVGESEPQSPRIPEWATVVLDLERRADRWVIVSRRRL
jgi:hypothetical protein